MIHIYQFMILLSTVFCLISIGSFALYVKTPVGSTAELWANGAYRTAGWALIGSTIVAALLVLSHLAGVLK